MQREDTINQFLETAGWAGATRHVLAGDASNRRYDRVTFPGRPVAVLMDAPKEKGEDILPFLAIARHLSAIGLSAPEILAANADDGLILMEDLGDDLFFNVVPQNPGSEQALYAVALDALDVLHQAPIPENITSYGPEQMTDVACVACEWYGAEVPKTVLHNAMSRTLTKVDWSKQVLVLRDYHAQNLLWLPDRQGVARVGQLDFQDAQLGHPLYDAASLINDARRDLDPDVRNKLIDILASKDADHEQFYYDFATVSAQRNLRILGVFARLCIRDGKASYVDLIPRVWRNLMQDLRHPDLADLAAVVAGFTPPTDAKLADLRARCGS